MSKKWGFCPICRQSVKRQGMRLKSGRRVNVIAPHWGGQEMCYGSEMPWESEACIPIEKEEKKKPDRYKVTIEEIPCENKL